MRIPIQRPTSYEGRSLTAEAIRCAECRRAWIERAERWRAYVAEIEGDRLVGLFCPRCASREFGD